MVNVSDQINVRMNEGINLIVGAAQLNAPEFPTILLQTFVTPGGKTTQGQIIEAVNWPWFEIIKLIHDDPEVMYKLDWRQWEEIIAGAYSRRGFEVILTPRSNDKGKDIIATSNDLQIRIVDQVKRYKPGHLVTLSDVDAMLGVLSRGQNISKGVVTTTSDFAPGIYTNDEIKRLMPYRLELKPRDKLVKELLELAEGR
jgi:restriction system protein